MENFQETLNAFAWKTETIAAPWWINSCLSHCFKVADVVWSGRLFCTPQFLPVLIWVTVAFLWYPPSLPILTSGNKAFTFTQLPPAGYFLLWSPTKSVSLLSDADFELESVVYLMSVILIALSCSHRDGHRPVIWVNLSWQSIAELFRWSKQSGSRRLLKMMLNLIKTQTQKTKKTKK